MRCSTIREGVECTFMSNKGCIYIGGTCYTAVEACDGCEHVISKNEIFYCKAYAAPTIKWRYGNCNFATHIKGEIKEAGKINPLKASKRAAGKK